MIMLFLNKIIFFSLFKYVLLDKRVVEINNNGNNVVPIEIYGNKFINPVTKEQFFIKGITYQKMRMPDEVYNRLIEPGYIDPLSNHENCLRDSIYLSELGVNVIRVYQINPLANHDVCMNELARRGIYVLVDLSEPEISINRNNPSWDVTVFKRYMNVVDSMHKYNNLLGFFAGNEVTDSKYNTDSAPFVKASGRDIKNYISKKKYRKIPVGYSSKDDKTINTYLSNYFICKNDEDDNNEIDFFGLNMYGWCGYSNFKSSGYEDLTKEHVDYPIPIFFSEYGCNAIRPRPFTEIEEIYGNKMNQVWSGGIVYEYFEEVNNYGIVTENDSSEIVKLPEFDILKEKLKGTENLKFKISKNKNIGFDKIDIKCDDQNSVWKASPVLPPTPNFEKCDCLEISLSCIANRNLKFDHNILLNEICSKTNCNEIVGNGSTGVYGKYSDCNSFQKLSFALNQHYLENNKDRSLCDYDGRAELKTINGNELVISNLKNERSCKTILDTIDKKLNTDAFYRNVTDHNTHTNLNKVSEKVSEKKIKNFSEKQSLNFKLLLITFIMFYFLVF